MLDGSSATVRVDQWVPALHRGDAIGDSARLMRDAFRSWGYAADVYALEMDDDLEGDGRRFSDWRPGRPAGRRDPPLRASFSSDRGPQGPSRAPRAPPPQHHAAGVLRRLRRRDGADLRPGPPTSSPGSGTTWTSASATASSTARSWRRPGSAGPGSCPSTSTSPATGSAPNPVLSRLLRRRPHATCSSSAAWLPNKRHDDLIRLASYWKRFISPDLRLLLVGKLPRRPAYFDALQALLYEEGFTPSEVRLHRATWTTTTSWPPTPPPTSSSP